MNHAQIEKSLYVIGLSSLSCATILLLKLKDSDNKFNELCREHFKQRATMSHQCQEIKDDISNYKIDIVACTFLAISTVVALFAFYYPIVNSKPIVVDSPKANKYVSSRMISVRRGGQIYR